MYVKMIVSLLLVLLAVASAGLLGGISDTNMNEEGAKDALQFAVDQHNRKSKNMYVSKVYKVVKVQTQVVAGMKYIFTVKMGKTKCRKSGVVALCTIPKDPANARLPKCKLVVWSQPWLNKNKLIKNTCK